MDFFKHVTACLFFLILSSPSLLGQEGIERNNQVWSGFSLNYKLNKKIQFGGGQQIRINNFESIGSNILKLNARYKWNKHFSTKLHYRYTFRSDQRDVNRYSLDLQIKWSIKRINIAFSYRPRLQHSIVTYTLQPSTYLRNKIKLEYKNWRKFTPFASYESFYKFNEHNEFRGNRFVVGLQTSLGKQLDLKTFYGIDQEINSSNPARRNIFAFLVSYDI